jgi:hypothetical protein
MKIARTITATTPNAKAHNGTIEDDAEIKKTASAAPPVITATMIQTVRTIPLSIHEMHGGSRYRSRHNIPLFTDPPGSTDMTSKYAKQKFFRCQWND